MLQDAMGDLEFESCSKMALSARHLLRPMIQRSIYEPKIARQLLESRSTDSIRNKSSFKKLMLLINAEATDRRLRKRKSTPVYFPDPPSDPEEAGSTSSSDVSKANSQQPSSRKRPKSESPHARAQPQKGPGGGKLPKNWVECPCCQQNFPMAIFNSHLDRFAAPNFSCQWKTILRPATACLLDFSREWLDSLSDGRLLQVPGKTMNANVAENCIE